MGCRASWSPTLSISRQNRTAIQNASNFLTQDSGNKDSKKKHLCNINDEGVSLQPDGSWAGPNCITSDGNGHAKHPEDLKDDKPKDSDDAQAKRAADMESHSCMNTDGADKANELADDCKKVADHPDKALQHSAKQL